MRGAVFTKTYPAPAYNRKEILRYAGVKAETAETAGLVDECLKEAADCFSYQVAYAEFEILPSEKGLGTELFQTDSSLLKAKLDGCHSLIAFVATVGLGIDRLIAKYAVLSPAKALIFQAIGAERIESLCDVFCEEIRANKEDEGEFAKQRLSPGYGDFSIGVQAEIFRALAPQKRIGVTLGKTLLMSPSKSVSAIIGIGKERKQEKNVGCGGCEKECAYRKGL